MRYTFFLVVMLVIGVACTTPQMQIAPDLNRGVSPLEVKGRQGWLVSQQLAFGPYHSDIVNRGWTFSYDLPFLVQFEGAREKLSFTLYGEPGQRADVACLGRLTQQDLLLLSKWFEVELSRKNAFSGTVLLNETKNWEFLLTDTDGLFPGNNTAGVARDNQGHTLVIEPVRRLSNGQRALLEEPLGYEFRNGNQVVGAVETVDNGRVWIASSLESDQRLAVAALAAALLLRSDLNQEVE